MQIISTIQALLLFEIVIWTLRVRGGNDLSALIGKSRLKAALSIPLILALVIAAMQPLESFLVTVTQYVFVESKHVTVCLYLLPCLFLLTALGASKKPFEPTKASTADAAVGVFCVSFCFCC